MRGHYLQAQNKAGLGAADAASGMTNFQALACTDLAVTPALDPLLAARYSLMDYVLGPSFACYVGCRYGLNNTAVHAYTAYQPQMRAREVEDKLFDMLSKSRM